MRRSGLFALGLMAGLTLAFAGPRGQAHDADQIAASAPQKNPLFINMTTGDSWRGWMGLHFAHATLKQGHPVAIFLNLDAVRLGLLDRPRVQDAAGRAGAPHAGAQEAALGRHVGFAR